MIIILLTTMCVLALLGSQNLSSSAAESGKCLVILQLPESGQRDAVVNVCG